MLSLDWVNINENEMKFLHKFNDRLTFLVRNSDNNELRGIILPTRQEILSGTSLTDKKELLYDFDIGITLIHTFDFKTLLLNGDAKATEILFERMDNYYKDNETLKKLIQKRNLFITKDLAKGYEELARKTFELSCVCSDTTKRSQFLASVLRDYYICLDILNLGSINLEATEHESLLSACRKGIFIDDNGLLNEGYIALIESLKEECDIAYEKSNLPDHCNADEVNAIFEELHLGVVNS